MATYKANIDTAAETTVYTVAERNIYPSTQLRAGGSDRLGMYAYPDTIYPVPAASTNKFQPIWHGYHKYELKNHLGNVMTVVNGNKTALDENEDGVIDGFTAQIEAAYDYSPFGVTAVKILSSKKFKIYRLCRSIISSPSMLLKSRSLVIKVRY